MSAERSGAAPAGLRALPNSAPTRAGLTLELPAGVLELVAQRAAELVVERVGAVGEDRWMTTRDAAIYLGLSREALHKLTAARKIPFSQDVRGGKCWFLRSELDSWRRGGGR